MLGIQWCTVVVLWNMYGLCCVCCTDNATDPDCIKGNADLSNGAQFYRTPSNVKAKLGGTAEFTCEGYYGPKPNTPYIGWYTGTAIKNCDVHCAPGDEVLLLLDSRYNSRCKFKSYERQNTQKDTIYGVTLTVPNVTMEDYNTSFQCRLISSRTNKPCATVKIEPYPPNKVLDVGWQVAIAVSVILLIIFVIFVVVRCFWGPQVSLFCYNRFGHFCQKYDPGLYENEVVVLHDEDDHSFYRDHIDPMLARLKYLRYEAMVTGVSPNQALFEGTKELIRNAYCTIFIITPEILNEALFTHLLNVALELKRQILILSVQQDGLKLPNWETYRKQYSRSKSLGNGLTYMKTIHWPGSRSSRRMKNFFSEIQSQLPCDPRRKKRDFSNGLSAETSQESGERLNIPQSYPV